jgi:nucleotide-binding universal stress UspA family protein
VAQRIVVGVDGSEHAAAALRFAVEEARWRKATLVAVHAWSYVPLAPIQTGYDTMELPPTFVADDLEREEQAARTLLDEALSSVPAGIELERHVVGGPADDAILDQAAGAALIVVGSHGHGRLASALLGSVSSRVIEHAPCPVVVVPG